MSILDLKELEPVTDFKDSDLNPILEPLTNGENKKTSTNINIEKLDKLIESVSFDIEKRKLLIEDRKKEASDMINICNLNIKNSKDKYSNFRLSLLEKLNTKESLELLIKEKKKEIELLKKRILDGDYTNNIPEKYQESIATAYSKYSAEIIQFKTKQQTIKNKLDDFLNGNIINGVKKRRGALDILNDDIAYMDELMEKRKSLLVYENISIDEMKIEIENKFKDKKEELSDFFSEDI